jgi:hypothetical protein
MIKTYSHRRASEAIGIIKLGNVNKLARSYRLSYFDGTKRCTEYLPSKFEAINRACVILYGIYEAIYISRA